MSARSRTAHLGYRTKIQKCRNPILSNFRNYTYIVDLKKWFVKIKYISCTAARFAVIDQTVLWQSTSKVDLSRGKILTSQIPVFSTVFRALWWPNGEPYSEIYACVGSHLHIERIYGAQTFDLLNASKKLNKEFRAPIILKKRAKSHRTHNCTISVVLEIASIWDMI